MFSDKFLHPHHIIPASKLVSALMKCTHHIILLSLNINKYIRMLIHHIFLQPQICSLLISGHSSNKKSETSELMALFYLHRRHCWILQPPYIRGPHSACFLLISGLWCYSTYIVDTAGFSSLRIFAIRTCVLLAHIRTVVLFYLHRRHGWLTPASVYSQSALRCSLLISGHSSNKKTEASELASVFLFSSLSTITSCPFRRRLRLALLECPL